MSLSALINYPLLHVLLVAITLLLAATLWMARRDDPGLWRIAAPTVCVVLLGMTRYFRAHEEHFGVGFGGIIATNYAVQFLTLVQCADLGWQLVRRFKAGEKLRWKIVAFDLIAASGLVLALAVSRGNVAALGPLSIVLQLPQGYARNEVVLENGSSSRTETRAGMMSIAVPRNGTVTVERTEALLPAFSSMTVAVIYPDGHRERLEQYRVEGTKIIAALEPFSPTSK